MGNYHKKGNFFPISFQSSTTCCCSKTRSIYINLGPRLQLYALHRYINIVIGPRSSSGSTRSPHLRLLQPTIRNSERKRRLGVKLAKSHLPIFLKLDFCYKISVIYFFLNVFPIVCYVFLHTCATRNSAPINFDIL